MASVLKFYKNCAASLEQYWSLHTLVFFLEVENWLHGRENVEYIWRQPADFLQTFNACRKDNGLANKNTWMILTFHNFAYIIWWILTRLEPR